MLVPVNISVAGGDVRRGALAVAISMDVCDGKNEVFVGETGGGSSSGGLGKASSQIRRS